KSDDVTMEYEIATAPDAPALVNVDVPPRPAGDARTIFSRVIPIHQVPPGKYILRAVLSVAGRDVKTLTRGFEIAAPQVLMTSADGLGDAGSGTDLYLPVDDKVMKPVFQADAAVEEDTIAPFRPRLGDSVRKPFEEGVTLLAAGDYAKAEQAFRKAIEPESDATAPLPFLASRCAGGGGGGRWGGGGREGGAGAEWQPGVAAGTDFAQIYDWLGAALLRNHDFGEARAIYEEAVGKWPADPRFTKPLAMLYGTFGRGKEAVRTLERYLDERQDDRDAYYYAVQWLYT